MSLIGKNTHIWYLIPMVLWNPLVGIKRWSRASISGLVGHEWDISADDVASDLRASSVAMNISWFRKGFGMFRNDQPSKRSIANVNWVPTSSCKHWFGTRYCEGSEVIHHYMTVTSLEIHGVSNSRQLGRLFSRFFWLTWSESSKICITGPVWRESTGDRWIPLTKGQ